MRTLDIDTKNGICFDKIAKKRSRPCLSWYLSFSDEYVCDKQFNCPCPLNFAAPMWETKLWRLGKRPNIVEKSPFCLVTKCESIIVIMLCDEKETPSFPPLRVEANFHYSYGTQQVVGSEWYGMVVWYHIWWYGGMVWYGTIPPPYHTPHLCIAQSDWQVNVSERMSPSGKFRIGRRSMSPTVKCPWYCLSTLLNYTLSLLCEFRYKPLSEFEYRPLYEFL
jgi:hypothetical protein